MAGDYFAEVLVRAIVRFLAQRAPHVDTSSERAGWMRSRPSRPRPRQALGQLPARPPTF